MLWITYIKLFYFILFYFILFLLLSCCKQDIDNREYFNLVGICETAHTRHDTKDVVVNGIDINCLCCGLN